MTANRIIAAPNTEAAGRAWYAEYLQSDDWRTRRALVLDRAGHICEGCRMAPATEVHHLTYKHVGKEFLWELKAVCRPCHERWHEEDKR